MLRRKCKPSFCIEGPFYREHSGTKKIREEKIFHAYPSCPWGLFGFIKTLVHQTKSRPAENLIAFPISISDYRLKMNMVHASTVTLRRFEFIKLMKPIKGKRMIMWVWGKRRNNFLHIQIEILIHQQQRVEVWHLFLDLSTKED